MEFVGALSLGLAAYLLGSLPFAYLLVRLVKGEDIRRLGSRNVGAINTYSQLGIWGGVVVLALDAGKGALAVLLPQWLDAPHWTVYLSSFLALAGHNWPVFLKFHGGKGVATLLGIALGLAPLLTLLALAPALLVMIIARNVVIAAALGFIIFNVAMVITHQEIVLLVHFLVLILLVASTYIFHTWSRSLQAIRQRNWHRLLYGNSLKPDE